MAVTLKKLMGEGGAGLDDAHGFDNLYAILNGIVTTQNAIVAAFNVLLAEYNAETNASHVDSAASTITAGVAIE